MIEYSPKHLIMVVPNSNNNKVYNMIPNGDTWTAEFGRVGSSFQQRRYSFHDFEKKYKEKIRKGYVDQTDLVKDLIVEKPKMKSPYKDIADPNIASIVSRLQDMAKSAIEANYTVSSNAVTQAMVDEAQRTINELLTITDVQSFNTKLTYLFTVIPRSMYEVWRYIAQSDADFANIISREQSLLDVMAGQVFQKQIIEEVDSTKESYDKTILEMLGLIIEPVDNEDIVVIKRALGSCAGQYHNAWRVTNIQTQSRFDDYVRKNNVSDTRLLFHGSRNENWWSILQSGLVLRPTNAVITGKMFGYGLYYAPKAKKSLGYTSLSGSYWARGNSNVGYMALMNVAYGKPYDVYSYEGRLSSFDYSKLQAVCPGANCLHAHEGRMLRNDEIIVYREEQSTIKYLVELTQN